jgi:hypothetical protein
MSTELPETSPDREPAELARLADGTLPAGRREALEREVAASPELGARLAEQRRAIEALEAAAVPAPEGLRQRIEGERRRAAPAARRRRLGFAAGLTVATAAAALVVIFLLPSSVPGGTVIAEAAELQALPNEQGAPAPAGPALLRKEAEGVPFPNYRLKFGWRASGQRGDRLRGRDATTVFYRKGGQRIGYTILSGSALAPPADARRRGVQGTLISSFESGGRTIVTWLREGRTCVMSGVGVPRATLYELAGWRGKGRVPF